MNEYLAGGRDNVIYRKENCVFRPSGEWTRYVHKYLKYLHDSGFKKVPYPFGIDQKGIECLSFVEGTIFNGILPEEARSDEALISVAETLREFHDKGNEYVKCLDGNETWMLPKREPIETLCHGDFAPYNIALTGSEVVGIIDFDTLHPGPRLWDIAYALYRWIPMMAPSNPENFGSEEDKHRRLRLFMDSYEVYSSSDNVEILKWIGNRLEFLINYMKEEAAKGNETFQKHIEAGHLMQYIIDLEYIRAFKY
jgi:hypothetical protein